MGGEDPDMQSDVRHFNVGGNMADAVTWRVVSRAQVERLAKQHSLEECKRELAQIFRIDESDAKKAYLLDFHVHNYSFARQQHFRPEQISVFLGILQSFMDTDFASDSTTTIETSYRRFQTLLLAHSVDRSPKSVQIFSPGDVEAIVDFVTHTYYRHFHLYKCVFTPFYHTHLIQKNTDGVQLPSRPRPLAEAFLHPQEEPAKVEPDPDSMHMEDSSMESV